MDIEVGEVHNAIDAGEIAAGNINSHHPINGAGMSRWIHVVGRLRSQLALRDWRGEDPRGRPVSNHNTLPYGLAVVGGNEITGIADHPRGPLAARKKGIGTAEAVTGTIPMIPIETLRKQPTLVPEAAPPPGNWFLLYYRSETKVRLEISLPLGFDLDDGQFTGWRIRVILPSWDISDPTAQKPLDVGGQDVDFQVSEVS
ncbi:hypothetical protein [Mycolicibacterium fortuitum]|uniref:hypothetical protein n=1 Tax=Mycolicibacterium fortuitum TaxID=1766 RepID=UPI00261CF415|nr:hypothetical protein [Mycolicibacterium fortuitum]